MLSLNEAFEFICPSQANWRLRAKSMCIPPRNYTCLFDVTYRVNVYRDRCNMPRILSPGYKYVFQPNLNRATCRINRYQPFIFDTVGNNDCIFQNLIATMKVKRRMKTETQHQTDHVLVIHIKDILLSLIHRTNVTALTQLKIVLAISTIIAPTKVSTQKSKLFKRVLIDQKSKVLKIKDFDNYKYNQACPTTPQNFDIVEYTDCSITIEWYIDDPKNCINYLIDYRVQGFDSWNGLSPSSKDISTDEKGYHVYTLKQLSNETNYELRMCSVDIHFEHRLQDSVTWNRLTSSISDILKVKNGYSAYKLQTLSPESFYEIRMCSVDGNVKSQYTEYKTQQTLKAVLPEPFKQLPARDRIKYNEIMQSSKTENRRLLKEDIDDVTSTDGVDIVVRRCKINTEDGEWTIDKDIDDDRVDRINRALNETTKCEYTDQVKERRIMGSNGLENELNADLNDSQVPEALKSTENSGFPLKKQVHLKLTVL
ncbi:TTN [Mytilus edulis]|uniref:TTN n=1 Tax=Mytilus edulis TaxID=6550 RepID=A0A8S3VJ45_MYTED|nr:TTN [Mytilus edulis]